MKQIRLFFILLLISTSVLAASPVATLESAANQILNALQKNKANLKTNPTLVYGLVNQYLLPHVDAYGMSRSVLGRTAWKKASTTEKKRFTKAFTQLVVRTYSGALRDYTDEKVKFLPLRSGYQGKKFVRVSSYIVRSAGPNISLKYSLVLKKGNWKVYDMSVEGVSLLQSFKSQFAQELKKGKSLSTLINRINKQKGRRG